MNGQINSVPRKILEHEEEERDARGRPVSHSVPHAQCLAMILGALCLREKTHLDRPFLPSNFWQSDRFHMAKLRCDMRIKVESRNSYSLVRNAQVFSGRSPQGRKPRQFLSRRFSSSRSFIEKMNRRHEDGVNKIVHNEVVMFGRYR